MENTEQRDNFLLGIVTILDNSADLLAENPDALSENPLLEALTANYLELFSILDKSAKSGEHSQEIADEWNEVFVSSMETYFLRMFLSIRKDQQPTPFVRSLLKVLFSLTEFPKDYPNDADEFVPELAVFNYPRFQEACIAHAFSLMTSDVEHVQLIGFAMARIMMPIMFKLENATALLPQNESEVVQNRPKLVLPVMIQKAIPPPTSSNIHPHLHAFLFDLALQPLATVDSNFGQEHRVAYCEAIDQFVRNALNVLLIDQPFDFRRQPILCRIPKSQERSYYLESDYTASPQFFDKFASRLLFKSISLLPAAVRLYYKSMSNSFMPMFHEAVTKYASKLLIEQELSKVKQAEFPGEMKVRTVPVTGEIIADYTVDETKMKLTIALPPDYPLAVPAMSLDKAIVKSDRAKKWLLQLNAYLFHQNGAILEGVEMWKRNVDKGIEG
uniref:E3 ubiquitin-protein ligase listerin n=1 Tax=Caenorhabditis japonica TaxID=281687 RepID=A0A8R1E4I2_CAEJA